jgi:hypothetical protein
VGVSGKRGYDKVCGGSAGGKVRAPVYVSLRENVRLWVCTLHGHAQPYLVPGEMEKAGGKSWGL